MGVGTFFTNDFNKVEKPDLNDLKGQGRAPPADGEKSKPLNM
jgi:hypothetical protein